MWAEGVCVWVCVCGCSCVHARGKWWSQGGIISRRWKKIAKQQVLLSTPGPSVQALCAEIAWAGHGVGWGHTGSVALQCMGPWHSQPFSGASRQEPSADLENRRPRYNKLCGFQEYKVSFFKLKKKKFIIFFKVLKNTQIMTIHLNALLQNESPCNHHQDEETEHYKHPSTSLHCQSQYLPLEEPSVWLLPPLVSFGCFSSVFKLKIWCVLFVSGFFSSTL